jgi:predicted Holliday junction resolvase-like endonuclease
MKTKITVLILILLVTAYCAVVAVGTAKINQLESKIDTQAQDMKKYEARTRDVLQNYDDMRKTQLVLIELYEGKGEAE